MEAPANPKIAPADETRGLGQMTEERRQPPCPHQVNTCGARKIGTVVRESGMHPHDPDTRYMRDVLALSFVSYSLEQKQASIR